MSALDDFMSYIQVERKYSSNTALAYESDIKQFNTFIENNYNLNIIDNFDNLNAITIKHFRAWILDLTNQKLERTSIHRKASSLKSYFRFFQKQNIVKGNPALRIILPKKQKKLPVFIPEKTIINMLDSITWKNDFLQARNQAIFEILYGCGIRRQELVTLKYNNVDLANKLLKVMGKGKKERILPFGETIALALKTYFEACDSYGLNYKQDVFITEKNEPIYSRLVYKIVNESLKLYADLPKNSPHILRHTYATHLLDKGADLNAVKELLGHSSLASTQVYTHNTLAKLKSVYKLAHPKS